MNIAVVDIYFPDRGYGFCDTQEACRIHFPIGIFDAGAIDGPPPIIGEPVDIGDIVTRKGRCPIVRYVRRIQTPRNTLGVVKSFDAKTGWGFIRAKTGELCFAHSSDFVRPTIASSGMPVEFYMGVRKGRPRACHITVRR